MKRYATPALIAGLVILTFSGVMMIISCQPELPELPKKDLPAYNIDIQFPPEDEARRDVLFILTMQRGSSITLPATVTSLSDVPIYIRLALYAHNTIPDSITFQTQKDYVTLEPQESIDIPVTFTVSELATTGSYRMGIRGELKEPVKERATMGQAFNLIIIDSQSEGD